MDLPGDILTERFAMLQADIDDMPAEELAAFAEDLRADAARDVVVVPVLMKKGRPGFRLEALCAEEDADHLAARILRGTTSLGVRRIAVRRDSLARAESTVEVRGESVRIKHALWDGEAIRAKAEAEDCERIARRDGATMAQIRREAAGG